MAEEAPIAFNEAQCEGAFDAARQILEQDHARTGAEVRRVARKRAGAVGAVAAVWAVCSIVLAVLNPDLLLVAEVGWIAVVVWAVFFMYPAITGQGNLDELYEQYLLQIDKLEAAGVPFPKPADMGDLVAALDLVSIPDSE